MNNFGNAALVLNADFRPLSYFPLSLWCWQDAIKATFLNRVNILSEYDDSKKTLILFVMVFIIYILYRSVFFIFFIYCN